MPRPLPTAFALLLLALAGCNPQPWYEGFREQQRRACYDLPSAERAACLEQTELSYRSYRQALREREEAR